jgi:hypothetical protein
MKENDDYVPLGQPCLLVHVQKFIKVNCSYVCPCLIQKFFKHVNDDESAENFHPSSSSFFL